MINKKKNLSEGKFIEIFISTVQKIWQKKNSGELKINFDSLKKKFTACQVYKIVEQVSDPNKEITSDNKLLQNKKTKIQENYLFLPVSLKKIINYKEILSSFKKNLQEYYQTERYQKYLPWQGKIVEGIIQEINPQYCLIDLFDQKKIGYWDKNEWLPGDIPQLGQSKRFLVKEVRKFGSYPVILARREEKFLRKLLEVEIPEIAQKKVIIQAILRLPGKISKVIVRSSEPIPNLLGICIGKGGERIRNVVQEIIPEKIELVEWQENQDKMLIKLLAPLKEKEISIYQSPNHKNKIVVVPTQKKSLVLAYEGELIRLIENYLALPVKIQIRTSEEMNEIKKKQISFKKRKK